MKKILAILFVVIFVLSGNTIVRSAGETAVTVNVDRTKHYQTMEGFGFFGAKDVWWSSSNPSHFYDDQWLDKIVNDLGITMWRNELYPNNPVKAITSGQTQWSLQKDMIKALKKKAVDNNVNMKILLTIWSPPADFKIDATFSWPGATDGTRGGAHPSTINGGTLDPAKYAQFAQWIIDGLDMYKEEGLDVYGISLQNEPWFKEPYNSCTYTNSWYIDLINNVVPLIKVKYPNIKVFGSENMLGTEASVSNNDYTKFYTGAILKNQTALRNIDAFAFHGYSDGVQATAIQMHKTLWESAYTHFSLPANKPLWMTETSGYSENWITDGTTPGALDLGIAIGSALKYGKASAWVFWQGSELGSNAQSVYSLMDGTNVKKRYYVSKQFSRYIRPGAVMIEAGCSDQNILSSAFVNEAENTFTSVLINSSSSAKLVTLSGTNVPIKFRSYLTTSNASDNCLDKGDVVNGQIILPANSIMTLVAENVSTAPTASPIPVPTATPTQTPTPDPTQKGSVTVITASAANVVNSGDTVMDLDLNTAFKTTVNIKASFLSQNTLYSGIIDPISKSVQINNVANGTYVLEIKRAGFLSRFVPFTVEDNAVNLGDKQLFAGDVTGDNSIDSRDFTPLKKKLGTYYGDEIYSAMFDFTGEGKIDSVDYRAIKSHLAMNCYNYNEDVDYEN